MNFCNVLIVDFFFVYLLKATNLFSAQRSFDLFEHMHFNTLGRITCTVLVLDLAMYLWHRLNHAIPLLWRFHRVHHTDLNVDVSSAAPLHSAQINEDLCQFLGSGRRFLTRSMSENSVSLACALG